MTPTQAVASGDLIYVRFIENVLTPVYQLALGVSVAYFLYGVMMFILNMNNEQDRTKGKQHLLYGTIGLFIMFSIGAIFSTLTTLFGGFFTN